MPRKALGQTLLGETMLPPKWEAYFTVDAFKNLMSTMTDTILQQVTGQVKEAMEAANFARPIPTFDYVPTARCESSHRHALARSHRPSDVVREIARLDMDGRSWDGNCDWLVGVNTT